MFVEEKYLKKIEGVIDKEPPFKTSQEGTVARKFQVLILLLPQ